jgi:hypothetical protein
MTWYFEENQYEYLKKRAFLVDRCHSVGIRRGALDISSLVVASKNGLSPIGSQ